MPLLPGVKQEIWAVNKNLPFSSVATMEDLLSRSTDERRFNLLLLGTFAAIALALAGIGIYGLISFSARQRNHEIGVRLALGASRSGILRMVIGEGMMLTLLGVAVGLLGAATLTRFVRLYCLTCRLWIRSPSALSPHYLSQSRSLPATCRRAVRRRSIRSSRFARSGRTSQERHGLNEGMRQRLATLTLPIVRARSSVG